MSDLSFNNNVARIYSFQTFRELKITITAIAGLAKGRATCHHKPNFEQPSMRAAFSRSCGILSKNVFNKRMLKDSPTLIIQSIYPNLVLTRCKLFIKTYRGTKLPGKGIIIAATNI